MRFHCRFVRTAVAFLVLATPVLLVSGRLERSHTSSDRLIDDIRYLTSPSLRGRGTGSSGLTKAADYISAQFARAGLKPLGGASYLQTFAVTTGAKLGPGNTLVWKRGDQVHALELGADFEPFAFSSSGSLSGTPVFAGYGVTACEYGYDDYAGIDVRGRIAVILKHEPQEYDSASPFEGRVYTEHSQIYKKLLNARAHGAKAVLLVNDTANHSGPDALEKLTELPSPGGAGLISAGLRADVAEEWFAGTGKSLASIEENIDRRLEPESFEFPEDLRIEWHAHVESTEKQVANVVGYLPGETQEYVIAGAHYDHLGTGEQFSLAPAGAGMIHPGADDNASGTAAVLALARWFGAQPKLHRGIVFAAFAGEEIGLLGSTRFTDSPALPLKNAVAMINMDMIGRMRERSLMVGGVASGDGLREIVETAARDFPFELQMSGQAVYGSSDHTAFTSHEIPVLFFFTGLHPDYHRPTDTVDKIDGRNTALIADLAGSVVRSLAQSASRPAFHYMNGKKGCTAGTLPHTRDESDR